MKSFFHEFFFFFFLEKDFFRAIWRNSFSRKKKNLQTSTRNLIDQTEHLWVSISSLLQKDTGDMFPVFFCGFFQLFLFSGESHSPNFDFFHKIKKSKNVLPHISFFWKNSSFFPIWEKHQFLEKGGGAM